MADKRGYIVVLAGIVALLCVWGKEGRDARKAVALPLGATTEPSEPANRLTEGEAVLRAMSLMQGFTRFDDPIEISCEEQGKGFVVIFKLLSGAANDPAQGSAKEIGRVLVDGQMSAARLAGIIGAQHGYTAEDRAIMAAVAHLHHYTSFKRTSILEWMRTSDGILVTITRTPKIPGGHVSVLVEDRSIRLIPGA